MRVHRQMAALRLPTRPHLPASVAAVDCPASRPSSYGVTEIPPPCFGLPASTTFRTGRRLAPRRWTGLSRAGARGSGLLLSRRDRDDRLRIADDLAVAPWNQRALGDEDQGERGAPCLEGC